MSEPRDEASAEEKRSVLGCYLLFYCLIVIPMIAIFLLIELRQGMPILQLPIALIRAIVRLDPLALVMVAGSLPLFVLIGRIGPRRAKGKGSAAP